jgi:5-methylcytosine-specific restriction endonuclease McrA
MPIRPENAHRYPADWLEIRARILQRAGHRCEWPGCGARNYAAGYWDHEEFVDVGVGVIDPRIAVGLALLGHRMLRIVLTIAHLDHMPENSVPENLRAWCQRHHLRYDRQHHNETAYMTRHARAGDLELF